VKIHRIWQVGVLGLVLANGAANTCISAFAAEPMPVNFVPPEQRNAAIRYLIAMIYLTPERSEKLKAVDFAKLGTNIEPSAMSLEFNEAAKLDNSGLLQWTIDGTGMSHCNFESNYEAGIGALLPQLGNMRQLAKALRLDARIQLTKGNADLAAKRVVAILHMGAHLKQDSWLIGALLGAAIDHTAFAETIAIAESPALTDAGRKELLSVLHALDTSDPLHYEQAIAVERGSIIPWLTKKAAAPDAWTQLKAELFEGESGPNITLSDEEVRVQIGQLGPAYDAFVVAVSSQTSDADAKKFDEKAHAGEWGTLAAIMMPAVENMRSSERKYRADLQKAIAALETPAKK